MNEEKKQVNKIKIAIAVVLILAIVVGIGIYVASRMNGDNEPTNDDIVTQVPEDPEEPVEPGEPTIEPEVQEQEPEPEPEEPVDPEPVPEPEVPEQEPEPEPEEPDEPVVEEPVEPEPTPEPEPEPEEPAQAREDMIFFEDTGEFNAEGFHKALMYIMENYEYKGMTLNKIFYERAYDNFDFFAVNWSEEDNNIYMYGVGDLKTYSNNNNKQLNITRLTNIDLKGANFENSLEKLVEECMDSEITGRNVYKLNFRYTEDDLDSIEDYYTKAYQMAEHRIEQELSKNEVVIGSFIEERKSMPAGLGIGDHDAIIVHYWVLDEKTNELCELTNSIHSSSVLGEGFVKNLMASPIAGSKYVVVGDVNVKDVITIEPETLCNVENGRVVNTKNTTTKTNQYAFVVDDKYYEL